MKYTILLALFVLVACSLRVELERKDLAENRRSDLIAAVANGNMTLVSNEQINRAIRGDYTPLKMNIDNHDQLKNPSIDLENYQDLQYSGPLTVGEQNEVFDVVYDTGSGWIWVNGKGCDGCSDSKHQFDPSTSSTFKSTGEEKTLSYGKGQVSGVIATDYLGLPGTKGSRTKFIPATSGKDNQGMQSAGIVGLTPVATDGEDLLVDAMTESGVIDSREFTTFIAHTDQKSYIEFGTNQASDSEITWVDLKKLPGTDGLIYWSTDFDAFHVGTHKLDLTYTSTIWDTGTSLIGFNPQDLAQVIKTLANGKQIYNVQDQFYAVECSGASEVSGLDFDFNGRTISVPSTEFVIEDSGYCIFLLMQVPLPGALLGDSFLRGLEIIHDQEGLRLGVVN